MKPKLLLLLLLSMLNKLHGQTDENDLIVALNSSQGLFVFDARNGTKKWENQLVGYNANDASPVVSNGVIYTYTPGGLSATSLQTGKFIWESKEKLVGNFSSPTISGNSLFLANENSILSFEALTGIKKWSFLTGGFIYSSPTVANNIVYFGSLDKKLYALDAATGTKKWEYVTANGILSSPCVVDGTVYFGGGDNFFYALDAATGKEKWKYKTNGSFGYSSPCVAYGIVYSYCNDGNLYALNTVDGTKLWEFFTSGNFTGLQSSPTVADGKVFFNTTPFQNSISFLNTKQVFALDAICGKVLWNYKHSDEFFVTSPTYANNTLFLGDEKGYVLSIDASKGTINWKTRTILAGAGNTNGIAASSSVVTKSGKVYNGTIAGIENDYSCSYRVKLGSSSNLNICSGFPTALTADVTGSNSPYLYKWKQCSGDLSTSRIHFTNITGKYVLEVTDNIGCVTPINFELVSAVSPSVNITGTSSFCAGQNTTLTANVSGGVSPYSYQWRSGGSLIGTNSSTYAASVASSYNVNVVDSKGCSGTANDFTVSQNPLPNVNITKSGSTDLLTGGSVVLSVPTGTNQTYQWLKDNVAISGATTNSYTVSGAGKYSVTVIVNGCSATSEVVTVNIILASEFPNESKYFKVSPNPFENIIKVNFNNPLAHGVKLNLINSTGVVLKEWTTTHQENILDVVGLPTGMYILKCELKDTIESVKLIKN